MAEITPSGVCRCGSRHAYDVPRQGILAGDNHAVIELLPQYAGTLDHLAGFDRIWVLFLFDRNGASWHPMVMPPRAGCRSSPPATPNAAAPSSTARSRT